MIYLDSSALLKLLFDEPESQALEEWIRGRPDAPMLSSQLATVEVLRACRRMNVDALPEARALLAQLDLIPLTTDVIDAAADVGASSLRSLDALHLASALSVRAELTSFLAYHLRLTEAANTARLEPLSPGT